MTPSRQRPVASAKAGERGAALVIAILVLAILTVIGIALMLVTSTESRIAANEWSVNRAFYGSDSGIRWASVEMTDPQFLLRPEFRDGSGNLQPFGTVFFQLPSHRPKLGSPISFFAGDMPGGDIAVKIQTPSFLGQRPYSYGTINEGRKQILCAFEVRSLSSDQAFAQYSKALVADVEIGPLPGGSCPF